MLALLDLDPNIVKPGWIPGVITLALAAVMVLLFFSLRRQFRRIDTQFPSQPGVSDADVAAISALNKDERTGPDPDVFDRVP